MVLIIPKQKKSITTRIIDLPTHCRQEEVKTMNTLHSEKWEALKNEVTRRGGDGEEFIKAMKEHYSIYNDGLLTWLGDLYDPKIGGFYYSKSGRHTDDPRFLPDIESTNQATNILGQAGLIDSFADLPKEMCDKMAEFVCSLQSDEDGFIYHPQWGKDISTNRRGRDMMWSCHMANKLGIKLPYKTANERLAEAVANSKTEEEKKDALKNLPDYLKTKEAFIEYLDSFDWTTRSYPSGNNLAAQIDQIVAAGLADVACDFLNEKQNKENGLWGAEMNFGTVNGVFKISYIYNGAKRLMPYAGKAAIAAMECITRFEEETVHVCSLYNTWYTVINLIGNMRRYGDETAQKEADGIVKQLLLRAPEAIRASTKKISEFRKPDGSFSYYKHNTACESQGALVAVPKPEGGQPDEGDVNATVIAATSLTSNMYAALELRDFAIKLYTKDDLKTFLDAIEKI